MGRTRGRWLLLAAAALLPVFAVFAAGHVRSGGAEAHPLGNFTINRYSRLEIYGDALIVHYVLDMAEIPAFQEIGTIDSNGDGEASDSEAAAYAARRSDEIAANLSLIVDGQRTELRAEGQTIAFPEGQAGLDTLRLGVVLRAPLPGGAATLEYADGNYAGRLGWKEIVAAPASGVTIDAGAPVTDVSAGLTLYPADSLSSPLDVRHVTFAFDNSLGQTAPAAVVAAPAAPAVSNPGRNAGAGFVGLVDSDNLTLTVVLIALLAALGFGALHALEPGHGKTFVAAYFVGVKGSVPEALSLGAVIAVTHTIGVLAIGGVTLFGSQYIVPERLYPWLSLASAVMILLLGLRLVLLAGGLRRLHGVAERLGLPHHHAHDHGHSHTPAPGAPPWRSLIALGLADGLTPSPSALVVLLAAVSLDRIGFGLLLIVSFSVGLAAVLTAVCLGLLFARRFLAWAGRPDRPESPVRGLLHRVPAIPALGSLVPLGGAAVLLVVGTLLTARALTDPALTIF